MKIELIGSVDIPVGIIFDKNITVNARLVYVALKFFRNRGITGPTNKELSKLLGMDKRTMVRHLSILENAGIIKREYDKDLQDRRPEIVIMI